jgi:hypothetical protein
MLLAPMFLAAALGQACPAPLSRYGPPPCAAMNVPGCVPGYRRQVDGRGRVTYVCVPAYGAYGVPAQPEAYAAPAPPPMEAPPAPSYAPAPSYQPRYGATYAAPRREPRGQLGIVLMPGTATVDRGASGDGAGAVALELRGFSGGARLRLGFEYTRFTRVADVALKYDFGNGPLRPFVALGLGGARFERADLERAWHPSASISGGLDLYLDRDFFVTLEAKQRAFTHDTPTGLEASAIHQTSFFVGAGFYF